MTALDFGQSSLPWFVPALLTSAVFGAVAGGRLGRALGVGRAHGAMIFVSFGIIVAATLTPQREALEFGVAGSSSCNFARIWLAELPAYLVPGETAGNVILFVPFAMSIALLPPSRGAAALSAAAVALPIAIETTQLLMPVLYRACESGDVVDNVMGLTLGLAIVAVLGFNRGRGRA